MDISSNVILIMVPTYNKYLTTFSFDYFVSQNKLTSTNFIDKIGKLNFGLMIGGIALLLAGIVGLIVFLKCR